MTVSRGSASAPNLSRRRLLTTAGCFGLAAPLLGGGTLLRAADVAHGPGDL